MELKFHKQRINDKDIALLKNELDRLEEERDYYLFKLKNGEDYKKLILFLFDNNIKFELA